MNTPLNSSTQNRVIAPLHVRRLRGKMEIKNLTMRTISATTGIPYTSVSAILCGRLVSPEYLRRIQEAIEAAPMPQLQPA
jgi:hypothetical protein